MIAIYMTEQYCVVSFAEENSDHSNLFSGRRGECMFKKETGKCK